MLMWLGVLRPMRIVLIRLQWRHIGRGRCTMARAGTMRGSMSPICTNITCNCFKQCHVGDGRLWITSLWSQDISLFWCQPQGFLILLRWDDLIKWMGSVSSRRAMKIVGDASTVSWIVQVPDVQRFPIAAWFNFPLLPSPFKPPFNRLVNFASHFKGTCHFHFPMHWVLLNSLKLKLGKILKIIFLTNFNFQTSISSWSRPRSILLFWAFFSVWSIFLSSKRSALNKTDLCVINT